MIIVKYASVICLVFCFSMIAYGNQITATQLNNEISGVEDKIDVLDDELEDKFDKTADKIADLKVLIVQQGEAIGHIKEELNRTRDTLQKIFFILISAVVSAIIGGGGLGFVIGHSSKQKPLVSN